MKTATLAKAADKALIGAPEIAERYASAPVQAVMPYDTGVASPKPLAGTLSEINAAYKSLALERARSNAAAHSMTTNPVVGRPASR